VVLPEMWPPELSAFSIMPSAVRVARGSFAPRWRRGAFGHLIKRGFGLLDLLQRLDAFGGVERRFDQVAPDR
jgi:hypothetical protein